MHTQGGLQVVIIDYFKSASDESDAYANYAKLGALVDLVKNKIAGRFGRGIQKCMCGSR